MVMHSVASVCLPACVVCALTLESIDLETSVLVYAGTASEYRVMLVYQGHLVKGAKTGYTGVLSIAVLASLINDVTVEYEELENVAIIAMYCHLRPPDAIA